MVMCLEQDHMQGSMCDTLPGKVTLRGFQYHRLLGVLSLSSPVTCAYFSTVLVSVPVV